MRTVRRQSRHRALAGLGATAVEISPAFKPPVLLVVHKLIRQCSAPVWLLLLTTALFCLSFGAIKAAEGSGNEDSTFIKVGEYQMTISSRTVTNYGKVEFANGTFALVINLSREQAAAINDEIRRVGLAYMTVVVDGHVVHDEIPVGEVTIEPFFIGPLTERQVDKAFGSLGVSSSWICHEEFVADTRWLRDQSRDQESEKSLGGGVTFHMRVIGQNKRVIERTNRSREFLCEVMLENNNATLIGCTHDHISYTFDEGKFSRKEVRPESHDEPGDVLISYGRCIAQ